MIDIIVGLFALCGVLLVFVDRAITANLIKSKMKEMGMDKHYSPFDPDITHALPADKKWLYRAKIVLAVCAVLLVVTLAIGSTYLYD